MASTTGALKNLFTGDGGQQPPQPLLWNCYKCCLLPRAGITLPDCLPSRLVPRLMVALFAHATETRTLRYTH